MSTKAEGQTARQLFFKNTLFLYKKKVEQMGSDWLLKVFTYFVKIIISLMYSQALEVFHIDVSTTL